MMHCMNNDADAAHVYFRAQLHDCFNKCTVLYCFPEAQPLITMKHGAPAVIKLAQPRLFRVI